jgi:hypothetical protein
MSGPTPSADSPRDVRRGATVRGRAFAGLRSTIGTWTSVSGECADVAAGYRCAAVLVALTAAMAVGIAACAAGTSGPPTPTGGSTDLPTTPHANGTPPPGATVGASHGPTGGSDAPSTADPEAFVLAEGVEHDVCGIALRVRFVPPSATGNSGDQAFLVGAPIPPPTGDQPLPSTVAPARSGTTALVLGRRFVVIAVDIANTRVTLKALC